MMVGDWIRRLALLLNLWRVALCWMDHFKKGTSWIPGYV